MCQLISHTVSHFEKNTIQPWYYKFCLIAIRVYHIFVISKRTLTKINFIVKVLSFLKKIHISRLLGIEQVWVKIHKYGLSGIDHVIVNNLTDKLVANISCTSYIIYFLLSRQTNNELLYNGQSFSLHKALGVGEVHSDDLKVEILKF